MKILSRMLIALLVLLGITFVGMQGCATATINKKKCDGTIMLPIGLDANGCEKVEPMHSNEAAIDASLQDARIGKECYRIRFWKDHKIVKEIGELALTDCPTNAHTKGTQLDMMQPSGTGQTQRVMLKTPTAREAFKKQMAAVKK
jgi:hypothetical protein